MCVSVPPSLSLSVSLFLCFSVSPSLSHFRVTGIGVAQSRARDEGPNRWRWRLLSSLMGATIIFIFYSPPLSCDDWGSSRLTTNYFFDHSLGGGWRKRLYTTDCVTRLTKTVISISRRVLIIQDAHHNIT